MNDINPRFFTLMQHSLHAVMLEGFTDLNRDLLQGLEEYIDDESIKKTHHFNGRYENIYIGADKIPALNTLIAAVLEYSAKILNQPTNALHAGLWFNVMQPGDSTTLHKHDDDDELLSAVYYVKVPQHSGTLRLGQGLLPTAVSSKNVNTPLPPQKLIQSELTPQAGMLVFFPPNMPHEVTENVSQDSRISLGINIGPKQHIQD